MSPWKSWQPQGTVTKQSNAMLCPWENQFPKTGPSICSPWRPSLTKDARHIKLRVGVVDGRFMLVW